MALDYLIFAEGSQYLLQHGLPSTCYFLLSTSAVSSLTVGSTLAGGLGEISGTGYARQSQAAPTPSGSTATFSQMTWNTGSATNWPSAVMSVILATTNDNSGKAICAWNLISGGGGTGRNMAAVSTTEQVTPTLQITS